MSYIGSTPTSQNFIAGTDYFNGTGSQTAFTLSRTVSSVNDIQAVVNNVVQVPNDAYTISGTTITFTSAPSAGTSNVYVRYLSTTTQSITPSQGTVSWSTLNADVQQDLGISFKNRLINGDFKVNQYNSGTSVTQTTSATYAIDRWFGYGDAASKFTMQQNAGSVTPPAGFSNYWGITSSSAFSITSTSIFDVAQRVEGYNIADWNWGSANAKTVTLSFWVRSSLTGTFGGSLGNDPADRSYPFSYTISAANTWEQKSITITGDKTGTWNTTNGKGLQLAFGLGVGSTYSATAGAWTTGFYASSTGATSVVGTSGATWYITGVMLEVGTQATTFDYRSYGTELSLCQRYYEIVANPDGQTSSQIGQSSMTNTTSARGPILTFKVNKRTAPTMTATGSWGYLTGATFSSFDFTQTQDIQTNLVGLTTVVTGGTAGQSNTLRTGSTTSTITASAEL